MVLYSFLLKRNETKLQIGAMFMLPHLLRWLTLKWKSEMLEEEKYFRLISQPPSRKIDYTAFEQ